jgi:hypothetical protein
MDNVIGNLIAVLLQGGPEVVAVLLLFIMLLLFDRKRLLSELTKKDLRIEKIVDDYHTASITLAEALNSLKMVLYELKSRLGG